jgi:hypothetical protein
MELDEDPLWSRHTDRCGSHEEQGMSGIVSSQLSRWDLKVSMVQFISRKARGQELKSLGPSTEKDCSLRVLMLAGPFRAGRASSLPFLGWWDTVSPQLGTKPCNIFQE